MGVSGKGESKRGSKIHQKIYRVSCALARTLSPHPPQTITYTHFRSWTCHQKLLLVCHPFILLGSNKWIVFLLKVYFQISVITFPFLLVPVVIMSDGKLAPGYKQWAGNRSAFGEIFASGNCMKITELQNGAQGHLGKP